MQYIFVYVHTHIYSCVIQFMGNKIHDQAPNFEEWRPHPKFADVFYNERSSHCVRRDVAVLSAHQEEVLTRRMGESRSYITKVEHYQILEVYGEANKIKYEVFTDAVHPLGKDGWVSLDSALVLLRAFRRLSNTYGYFKADQSMVRMNQNGDLKVWINPNPALYEIEQFLEAEETMLADVTRILMKYDSETAALMAGCKSFNQCMNSILMSLSKNWAEPQLSNRTATYSSSRHQPSPCQDKTNFRSTKETQDQFHSLAQDPVLQMSQRLDSSNSPSQKYPHQGSEEKTQQNQILKKQLETEMKNSEEKTQQNQNPIILNLKNEIKQINQALEKVKDSCKCIKKGTH